MDIHSRRFFVGACAAVAIVAFSAAGLIVGMAVRVPVQKSASVPSSPIPPVPSPAPEAVAATEPLTVSKPSSTVSLLFVGDIMLDRNVRLRSLKAGSRSYPFAGLPQGWFDTADYAVANLEGPVTAVRRPPEKSIDFQFDPETVEALERTGIDAFSQANNHALDQGNAGYADSVARLRKAGFLVFGHQVQDGEVAMATTTVKGISFAFLGFNVTDNPFDYVAAERVLVEAKAKARIVLVYMHWGEEYRDHPTGAQVALARWLVDHGADGVIGGHPHWVQGMELYAGAPIFYSLGNFVFDQDFSAETREGLAVRLLIDAAGIAAVQPIPIQIDRSQPRVLEGEERAARLKRFAAISDPSVAGVPALRARLEEGDMPLRFSE